MQSSKKILNNNANEEEQQMFQFPIKEDNEIVENTIYFYGDIDMENALKFNINLRKLNNENLIRKVNRRLPNLDPIYIHINSGGGSVFDGFSIMDNIQKSQSDVITIIDGFCASAATFMSVVGKKRLMYKHSYFLIHQISTGIFDEVTLSNLDDEHENCHKIMNMVKEIYLNYTKIGEDQLDNFLKHDWVLDSDKALELGFIDEII